jgi:flagella basal body P-ring formation protein FlgA
VIAYEKVLLVTHDIGVNHPFTAADLRLEEREVEAASVDYFHSPEEIVGKVPARVLKAGQVLRRNMVQMPVAVEVGTPVDILVDVNGIKVKAEGIALQKGRIGAYIRVKNARSGKFLRGKVIDGHTVQIE